MEIRKTSPQVAMLTLMLATSMPAFAQSVADLADLQAQTLILKAKAAKAEAQASLDAAEGKIKSSGGTATESGAPALPVVKGVYGSGRLIANLLFDDGATMEVSEGDLLQGGLQVRSISVDRVVLGQKGRAYPLRFSQIKPMAPEVKPTSGMQMPMPAPFLPSMPAAPNTKGAPQ